MDNLLIRCTYRIFFLLYCASISQVYSYKMVKRDVQNVLHEEDAQVFYIHGRIYPRDCSEVLQQCPPSNKRGVHFIQPDGYLAPFEVYCSNDGTPGGWTVIQRRLDASINFSRQWYELKHGFGFLGREFWLGNDKVSYLTNQADYELQIDLVLSNGFSLFINYNKFRITDEWSNYTLIEVGGYSGNADNVTTTVVLPKDCYDLYTAGNTEDGVYTILPSDWPGAPFEVLCNMTSDGGGWTELVCFLTLDVVLVRLIETMTVAKGTIALSNREELGGMVLAPGALAVTGMSVVFFSMITATLLALTLISTATTMEETVRPLYGIKTQRADIVT
ncbi:Fibrinogen-like protein A [Holothuria leucospilota]|uniref:Fibrinogen-like protein A n=1 Tax=Holothuria leucospilota TaxID=206669 RepID=A0A9Q1BVH4_HOLLE|nr:Fibrinogen-like protein A [Holothuria leucospilota]